MMLSGFSRFLKTWVRMSGSGRYPSPPTEGSRRYAVVQLSFPPRGFDTEEQSLWIPEEPLLGSTRRPREFDKDYSVRVLRLTDGMSETIDSVVRENSARLLANERRKLEQILRFCTSAKVDVVVFPEYSVAPENLDVIHGFAQELTVIAGLGIVREGDRDRFEALGIPMPRAMSNAVAVLGPGVARIVTKKKAAQSEKMEPGKGPSTIEVTQAEHAAKFKVAICLDHIASQSDAAADDGLDWVAVPALTDTVDDFAPKVPRRPLRLFSNHAAGGGTAVFGPDFQGVAFRESTGTEGLPPGNEGVVVVDFEGYRSKPSSLAGVTNRVVLYSQITYSNSLGSGAEVAREIAGWQLDDFRNRLHHQDLERLRDLLAGDPLPVDILFKSIRELRAEESSQGVVEADFGLLTTHLVLDGVLTQDEIAYSASTAVREAINRSLNRIELPAGLGRAFEAYVGQQRRLVPYVREQQRTSVDRSRLTASSRPRETEFDEKPAADRFFVGRLGTYNSNRAVQSLPLQLAVLRSFANTEDDRLAVIYRLSTEPVPSGDFVPFFDVIGVAHTTNQDYIESLSEGLGQQMGVAYSAAWHVLDSDPPLYPNGEWRREIRPVTRPGDPWAIPPVSEDWGSTIDLIRTQKSPLTIDIVCRPAGRRSVLNGQSFVQDSAGFAGKHAKRAAEVMLRAERTEAELRFMSSLSLSVVVTATAAPPDTLLSAMGYSIFGGHPFEIVEPDDEYLSSPAISGSLGGLLPSQAIRVFHPPFGQIQSRGLERTRATDILARSTVIFPTDGAVVGQAKISMARNDGALDVRLDAQSRLRHVYLLGKTGSGKTNFLKLLARQDIAGGVGIAVIDPHGDLVEDLLKHVGDRVGDVTLLDFGQTDHLPILNPLNLDIADARDSDLAVEELVDILRARVHHTFTGPVFEDLLRLVFESMTHPNYPFEPSILDAGTLLRNVDARAWVRSLFAGEELEERWRLLERRGAENLNEMLGWALAKFGEMSRDGVLRQCLGSGESTVSINGVVANRGVLLVRLPESVIGKRAASFLGSLILSRLRRAMYTRVTGGHVATDNGTLPPFYLYVDEFQQFATSGFEDMVAEARKFGLGLVLAHQNLQQLKAFSLHRGAASDDLLEAVLGNVGNLVVMRTGHSDRLRIANEIGVKASDIEHIGQYEALARVVVDGREIPAISLSSPDASRDEGSPRAAQDVEESMKESVWVERSRLETEFEEGRSRILAAVKDYEVQMMPSRPSSDLRSRLEELRGEDKATAKPQSRSDDIPPPEPGFLLIMGRCKVPDDVATRVRQEVGPVEVFPLATDDVLEEVGLTRHQIKCLRSLVGPADVGEKAVAALVSQAGLTSTVAVAVLHNFGTLREAANADSASLQGIRGIGAVRAAKIRALGSLD